MSGERSPRQSYWAGARSTLLLLAAAVLPNLVLLACSQFLFMQRAWINVDYLVLCALGLALPKRKVWLAALLVLTFIVDIAFAFAPAYHFTPGTLWDSTAGLADVGAGIVTVVTSLLLAAASLVAWLMVSLIRRVARARSAILILLMFGVSVFALDSLISKSMVRIGDLSISVPNLGFSTALKIGVAVRTSNRPQPKAPAAEDVQAASDVLRTAMADGSQLAPLIMLVNIESLGLFHSQGANEYQLAPLAELDDHPEWQVSFGTTPFAGSTVAGELRELCRVRYETVSPALDRQLIESCLVQRLKKLGFRTLAFHGFQGTFFERNRWYEELGFDDVYFGSDMMTRFSNLHRCGSAFEGVCDRSAWDAIAASAIQLSRPTFVYWMTLTAHLPVLPHKRLNHHTACAAIPEIAHRDAICDHVEWHRSLFRAMADDLRQGHLGDVRLILVGDHPPPFLDRDQRALFSDTHVPYIDIRNRQTANRKTEL